MDPIIVPYRIFNHGAPGASQYAGFNLAEFDNLKTEEEIKAYINEQIEELVRVEIMDVLAETAADILANREGMNQ